MLPFALKTAWFCLSFTGMIASWIIMTLFARGIGSYWGPGLYVVFATMLEVIFCLGMIWEMDPFKMPRAFCIAQTFIIYYAAWSLTGVISAFTFATTSNVLWPSTMRISAASTLSWHNRYCFPIFIFPLACLCVSVPVLLHLDAIQPTDDLHCDASKPEWGRFLGYSGLSLIITIPCFFLSAAAARRVLKMHRHSQRSSPLSPRYPSRTHFSQVGERDVVSAVTSPATVTSPNLFTPAPLDPETPFAHSSKSALTAPDVDEHCLSRYDDNRDGSQDLPPSFDTPTYSQKTPPQWTVTGTLEEDDDLEARRRTVAVVMSTSTRVSRTKPNLTPAIWRLIIFQLMFFVIQFLAALSTIIDVAKSRPTPTPFGSQHIALVLVGWGPTVVFGHLPAVRRQLMFWKKRP